MNDTKRMLIKISAIISIIEAVSCLLSSIMLLADSGYFGLAETGSGQADSALNIGVTAFVIIGVVMLILGVCGLVGGILLLKCEKNPKTYVPGAVLTIIGSGGLSLPAILLYVSFAIKDSPIVVQKPEPQLDVPPVEKEKAKEDKLKRQIDILREMKANGQITEQEFKELMMDLIKKY